MRDDVSHPGILASGTMSYLRLSVLETTFEKLQSCSSVMIPACTLLGRTGSVEQGN